MVSVRLGGKGFLSWLAVDRACCGNGFIHLNIAEIHEEDIGARKHVRILTIRAQNERVGDGSGSTCRRKLSCVLKLVMMIRHVKDAIKKEQPFQRHYVSTRAEGSRSRRSYVDGLHSSSSTPVHLARDRNENNFSSYVLEWLLWAPSLFDFIRMEKLVGWETPSNRARTGPAGQRTLTTFGMAISY